MIRFYHVRHNQKKMGVELASKAQGTTKQFCGHKLILEAPDYSVACVWQRDMQEQINKHGCITLEWLRVYTMDWQE